ncbi:MAG: class I SAM-dependent methyltransferase [Holophagales bacterium]|nr:class I SAM-dependent methyltransferase [Holophagales bacterium]
MRSDDRRVAPWPKLDPARRSAEVRAYFDRRAAVYDPVADRPYWAFSDEVLLALLRRTLLAGLGEGDGLRILDAGGGTGRWALRLLRELPRASALLADISPGMLEVARRKAARSGARDRLSFLELDLNSPLPRRLGPFEVVLCFHNVAGLVADPAALVRRLVRAAAPGGRVAFVLPNLWQAAARTLSDGRPAELGRLATRSAVPLRRRRSGGSRLHAIRRAAVPGEGRMRGRGRPRLSRLRPPRGARRGYPPVPQRPSAPPAARSG